MKALSPKCLHGVGVIIVAIVILWRLLLPGYVLTLDMFFVPRVPFPMTGLIGYANTFLFRFPLYLGGLFVAGWVVQKLVLVVIIIACIVHGYKYVLEQQEKTSTQFWTAIFFAINPFVYTRFLAGQWMVLVAYSFLPLVWHFTNQQKDGKPRSVILLALSLVFTFAFSLHLGVIALFVWLFALIGSQPVRSARAWLLDLFTGGLFFIGSLYWLIPAFLRKEKSLLEIIDTRHLEAFRTASDPLLGTIGNVLALGGFWGEREYWATQFIWPLRQQPILWGIAGGVLAALIMWGMITAIRTEAIRRKSLALLALGALAVIFSCGIGDSIFSPINNWLFSHVGFWTGFRDSQKWSAVLVLVYAYFGGKGIEAVSDKPRRQLVVTIVGVLATLVFTYPMLFGFWGQLKPVWYPDVWKQANDILKQDPNCKALFLPWHAYFALKFNHNLLTASPARDYFDCELVMSRQVELGEVGQQGPLDPAYDAIEGVVTGKDGWNPQESLEILRTAGIKYVVFAKDIKDSDPWKYEFLNQPSLKSYTWDGLTIYQLTN